MTEKKTSAKDKKSSKQEAASKELSEKKSASKKEKPKKAAPVKASSSLIPYLLIIIVFSANGGGLYVLWQQQQQAITIQKNNSQNISNINQQQQQNAHTKKQLVELASSNKQKINDVNNNQKSLYNNLSKLVQDNKQLRKDWLMAEAEYLIQIANHRLLLEKDVATATVALKSADARLADISDPALLNIRKSLAKDIQTLNNIKQIDLAGLSVKITAMENNIPNLPLNTPDPKTYKVTKETQPTSNNKELKDLPATIWNDIKNLVVIRNHEKPLQPLLTPSQHFFLQQNLTLTLEQARLALLSGDQSIFQERLTNAEKWINNYFDTEHNVSRNMLASIAEMREIDINPDLPDISSTFSLIKKYRLHGQPKAVTRKTKEKS